MPDQNPGGSQNPGQKPGGGAGQNAPNREAERTGTQPKPADKPAADKR